MCKPKLHREYDEETGKLIKLECGICHEIKTADCFRKNKSKKDGIQSQCKQCCSEIERQYRENNKEKISKKRHQYYENNKEKINERQRQWNENNKEKRYDYIRQWYQNNKEKISEINHQYHENKVQQEIIKIHENVTKQRYPNKGIQYGVIYGVVCNNTNRWYIGQTTTSFNTRYHGDFFKNKLDNLLEDNIKGKLLADDIEKYGQENFEIIEVLDVAFSEKELDEKEVYYIDLYKAYDEGYNSRRGNIFKHGKAKRSDNNEIYK